MNFPEEMNDEIQEPWEELSKDELDQIFLDALDSVNNLHEKLITSLEDVGYARDVLSSLYPRYMGLFDKAEEDPSIYPIIVSGVYYVRALSIQFDHLFIKTDDLLNNLSYITNSTGTFGSSSDASTELFGIDLNGIDQPIPPPKPRKSKEEYLARLRDIDPSLADSYKQVWQIFYGTNADRYRASLFMMRQVYDHFFGILAPDDQVRESKYWEPKKGDKPKQVFRSERINYAAHRHIKDFDKTNTLSASSRQISDLYKAANLVHKRGLLDEKKTEKTLHAMDQVLLDWIDAIY